MRITILGEYPRDINQISGGVESVVLYLTQALQHYLDLKLNVITLDRKSTKKRVFEHQNVTVNYLPESNLPSRLAVYANVRRMRQEILKTQPDLVHAHIAGPYAEAAAKSGSPWVLTPHGIRFLEVPLRPGFFNRVYRGWFIKRDELRAIKNAKHIISISPFVQETFGEQIRAKVYDIENPIDPVFFQLPRNPIPGQLLFVGHLIPRKGVHTLLRAFQHLHERNPKATLRLAGRDDFRNQPNSYPQQLKKFVAQAGLEKSVRFLGEVEKSRLLKEYSNCSALVLSSVLETAPMVIMEAMAAGKAVVSTDAGGARYLIDHGETGQVVPVKDECALAEALYQTLEDDDRLEDMGLKARQVAKQRFHSDVIAAQTRDAYYDILADVSAKSIH
jgi:glycosyltransferase involved in cell wall biosynthesis